MIASIDGIEFAHAFRRNEPDRFYLTAAKIAVIDSAIENCSDSDLKTISHCAKIIRQEILKAKNWQFDGKLDTDTRTRSLRSFLPFFSGFFRVLRLNFKEKRVGEVCKKATLILQQIMHV